MGRRNKMYISRYTKLNRIVASLLVICMLAMAAFPYGNISYASTTEGSSSSENGGTEPGSTEPESTEPESTEPGSTEPGSTEPESTEPESTEPESTEPERTEPGSTEPGSTEPESTEPESTEPESTEPESTEPESTEPGSTEPGSTEPGSTENGIMGIGNFGSGNYSLLTLSEEYTITYLGLEGATIAQNLTSYTPETQSFTLNNPTKAGYAFMGWIGTDLDSTTETVTILEGSTGNREYTAVWSAPFEYAITYLGLENATVTENPLAYTVETESFTLNNPTKDGYTFTGWTGTGVSTPNISLTISKGSTGAREYTANWSNSSEFNPSDSNPTILTSKIEVISGKSLDYVTIGDKIRVTFTGTSLKSPSVKFFNEETEKINATVGIDGWIVEKTITEADVTENTINYYIYDVIDKEVDGVVTKETVFLSPIRYSTIHVDITAPEKPDINAIVYGGLGSNTAKVTIKLEDNFEISQLKISKDGQDSFNNINVNKSVLVNYEVNSMGVYSFYAIDGAGNISEAKTVEITKGNTIYMSIVKYPKQTFLQGEAFTLEGGKVKVGYTFDVCEHEPECQKICVCADECSCEKVDGVCTPGEGCQNEEYECLIFGMEEMDYDVTDSLTQIVGKDKAIYLKNPNHPELSVSYTIDVVSGINYEISFEEDKTAENTTVNVTTDLTNLYYTWSTNPNDAGREVYRGTFLDDTYFTYVTSAEDSEDSVGWFVNETNSTYNAPKLVSSTSTTETSTATITINTGDTTGVISFEYMTNTRNGDTFNVTVNGEKAMTPASGISSKWNTFSKLCEADANGNFEMVISYEISGKNAATSEIPVTIRNLTFEGDKKWTELTDNKAVLKSPLGPNNYLFIKGDKDETTVVATSPDIYKGSVNIQGIEIHTVPNKTFYVEGDDSQVQTYGGKITLVYNIGTEKIDMSEGRIYVDNTGNGDFIDDTIDLTNPGVKQVKVTYDSYSAYFSIMVGYDANDTKTIRENRNEANAPLLLKGMIPVKWYEKGGYWVTTTTDDADWYNYTEENVWANVMLRDGLTIQEVEDLSKYKDLKLLAGKRVLNEGSSFVWIPRYTYLVDNDEVEDQIIKIKWSDGITDDTADGYKSHPAFTYGTNELTGFWMAKYEASEGEYATIASKPGQTPYYYNKQTATGGISLQTAYDFSVGMDSEASEYGIDFSGAISHLTKQAEWGAVAMLSYSQYGEVPFINNYMLGDAILSTGYNGDSMSAAADYRDSNSSSGASKYLYEIEGSNSTTSSTTSNIYGIFDMSGGVNEYVASYVITTADAQDWYLTNYDANDVDIIDINSSGKTLYEELIEKEGWAIFDINDLEPSWAWQGGTLTTFHDDRVYANYSSRRDYRQVFFRGGLADAGKEAGILAVSLVRASSASYYGFRPTILVTDAQEEEEVTIDLITIKISDKEGVWAKSGDVAELKIEANGAININDFVFKQGTGDSTVEMESTSFENGYMEWIFRYEVKDGDNGELGFSFNYDGREYTSTTDGSKVKMDTSSNTPVIDIVEGENGVTIIVTVDPDEGSGTGSIIIVDKDGNIIGELPSNGGSIDIGEEGNYTIIVEDEAGNKSETGFEITPGDLNNTMPSLTGLSIKVKDETMSDYVDIQDDSMQDKYYILEDYQVRFDLTFDQELTVGPKLTLSDNREIICSKVDENDSKVWYAEFTTDSKNAYDNFIFKISGYKYEFNDGITLTQDNYNFNIPYDGSNVNVEIGVPKIYQYIDNVRQEVETITEGYEIDLEYVVTFSDKTIGPNTPYIDNFDTTYSINLVNGDITIYEGLVAEEIIIEAGEANNQKKITFKNVTGTGQFIFSIRGATVDEPVVVNPVAKDIYGHPNNKTTTTGNAVIWITADKNVDEYQIVYDANGGEGAPDPQVKTRNIDINLRTEIPTKVGHTFSHWEGVNLASETVTYNPGDLYTADASILLKAIYTVNQYSVTAVPSPTRGGSTEGSGYYYYGETVTLTATPEVGYRFSGWVVKEGGAVLADADAKRTTFTMPASDVKVEATFERKEYTVTIVSNSELGGTLTGAGTYNYDELVTLTATVNEGYEFVGWEVVSGELELTDSTNTTVTFNMPAINVTVKAIYGVTLTVETINTKTSGTEIVGTSVAVSAEVSAGFTFTGWTATGITLADPTKASLTFNMPDNVVTLVANYTADTYKVTVTTDPTIGGTVSGGGTYNYADEVILTATANTGYTFTGWTVLSGNVVLDVMGNIATFTMPLENVFIRANFETNIYNVITAVSPTNSGVVVGGGAYNYGSEVTLTATPNTGYTFTGWTVVSGGISLVDSTSSTISFTMPANDVSITANFSVDSYTVTTLVKPEAGGIVNGGGTYNYSDEVILIATPNTGYTFTGWDIISGNITLSSTTELTTTFAMPAQDVVIRANFEMDTYEVITTVEPIAGGSVAGGGSYNYGANVNLTAVATTGYRFVGWTVISGGVTLNETSSVSATFTMPAQNVEIRANFEVNSYDVIAVINPTGSGNVAGTGAYGYLDEVTLTATANTGYRFVSWSVISGGIMLADTTATSISFTMPTKDVIVQANFVADAYMVTGSANPAEGGSISGTGSYNYGAEVTLTAITNSGYRFTGWEVISGGVTLSSTTDISTSFTMPANDVQVRANFIKNSYTVTATVTPTAGGTVSGAGAYDYLDEVTLIATANTGYTFTGWEVVSGGVTLSSETNTSTTFTMPANDVVIKANFEINTYTVTAVASPSEYGTVTGGGDYAYGSTVTLNAVANTGYEFLRWVVVSGGVIISNISDATATFTMPASDVSIRAEFGLDSFNVTVTLSSTSAGSVAGAGNYNYLDEVILTATENEGYNFIGWEVISGGVTLETVTSTSAKFVMPSNDVEIKANFEINEYTVTVSANPEAYGSVTGGGTYTYRSRVILTATANDGYVFSGWTVVRGGVVLSNVSSVTFTMPSNDVEVIANFESDVYVVTGTVDPADSGSISGLGGYDTNTEVTLTAIPNTGYRFIGWEVVSGGITLEDTSSETVTFTMPSNNVEVKANFELINYTVTAVANPVEAGSVTGGGAYTYGSNVALTAVANEGYIFTGWEVVSGGITLTDTTSESISFTMPANNVEIRANFEIQPVLQKYTLTVETPFAIRIEDKLEGISVTATATSDDTHTFTSWSAVGLTLTAEQQVSSTITFTMPSNAVTLTAHYNGEAPIEMVVDTTSSLSKSMTVTANDATTIDWGDGTVEEVTLGTSTLTHTYETAGNFNVKILDNVITSLSCGSNNISSLTLGTGSVITTLDCSENNLTILDVNRANGLTELNCSANSITGLNVSTNTSLTTLDCSENSLSNLDLSGNTVLTTLNCQRNSISNLDVSQNTALTSLHCGENNLTALDVSKNTSLTTLSCAQSTMEILVMDSTQTVVPSRDSNTYIVRMTQSTNGTISYTDGLSFEVTPNSGYTVATLTVGEESVTPSTSYTFSSLTSDTTITATFGVNYTVTFNSNGGMGSMTPQAFVTGVPCNLKANAFSKAGYEFAGWSTTLGGNVEYVNEASYTATADVTLYAVWSENGYTVTFNKNGGTGTMTPQTFTYNVAGNLKANEFTKEGYTFSGWATSLGGSVKYENQASYTARGNATLYAVWTINEYTLTVNPGGTTYNGNYNTTKEVTAPLQTGYTVTYNYNGNGDANTTATSNKVFSSWTLSGGGSISSTTTNPTTYTYGTSNGTLTASYTTESVTLPTPTRSGYAFDGWYTASSSGTKVGDGGASYTPTADVTLYAQWTAGSYTVSATSSPSEGGSVSGTGAKTYGSTVTLTATPNTGYTFSSWEVVSGGVTLSSTTNTTTTFTMPANNVSIKANFTANSYTLTVNPGGTTYNGNYNTTKEVTAPVQTGYTVTYNYNGNGDANTTATSNKIFSSWELSGGGSISSTTTNPTTYTYGTSDGTLTASYTTESVTLPTPTREGYTFDGWYTASSSGTKVGDGGESYTPTADVTLYAHWNVQSYTVSISGYSNGSVSGAGTKTYGSTVTLTATPNTGYTFSSWEVVSGGVTLSSTTNTTTTFTMPANNVVMMANFMAKTYTIAYNANGGTGAPENQTKTHGVNLTLSSTEPTKEGYNFLGWATTDTETSAEYLVGATFTTDANTTLYAVWEEAWAGWNAPKLGTSGLLTPVNWNGSTWVTTDEANWDYNYEVATAGHNTVAGDGTGKWANAQTSDGSLYVWIPRYTYKITSGEHSSGNSWSSVDSPGTNKIEVKFSNGTTDDTTDSYISHPAFTFGEDELEGIWVAKYEASRNDATSSSAGSGTTVSSKPGVVSWRSTTVSDMYGYAYNLNRTLDSHLMKNSEWGAVAYLTNAIGKIPYINNSSSYITGNAGGSQDASSASGVTNAWNTAKGVKASSTHNVYGIYDLSGGAWEYVSAYYTGGSNSHISNLTANKDTKYVEAYSTAYDSSKKGDAVYETSNDDGGSSWDRDYSYAPASANPVFSRGGDSADTSHAGVFYFFYDAGHGYSYVGFRPVLAIP